MRMIEKELLGVSADDDGVVASVTPAAGGEQSLTLIATSFDPPRRLVINCAGDETSRTFTITGVDRYGHPRVEAVTGVNADDAYTTWEYESVSEITVDDDTAGAIKIGWDNVFYSQWFPMDEYRTPFNVGFGVIPQGTVNYTVQHCRQIDIRRNGALGHNDPELMVFDHPSVVGETTQQEGNYSYPVTAIRLKLNSCNNGEGALIRIKQAWY